MQTRSEFSQTTLSMPSPPIVASGPKFAFAAARLQAHAFKAMMRYQIEALAFLKHRYEEDVKFVNDLVGSNEFNDAFDVVHDLHAERRDGIRDGGEQGHQHQLEARGRNCQARPQGERKKPWRICR